MDNHSPSGQYILKWIKYIGKISLLFYLYWLHFPLVLKKEWALYIHILGNVIFRNDALKTKSVSVDVSIFAGYWHIPLEHKPSCSLSVSLRTMSYIHYRLSITLNQQLLLKKLVHTNLSELGLAEMLWKWEVKLKSLFAYLEYAQNFIILSNYLAPWKGKIKWHVWNITPDL